MPEAVAVAGGHQRVPRAGGGDERGVGRAAAAVVRDHHDVGPEVARLALRQALLHRRADVAGEQQRAMRGFHPQHAARLVAQRREVRRRVQQAQPHAIVGPGVAGHAGPRACEPRVLRRQQRHAWPGAPHRVQAAGVVVVAMARDQPVDAAHAQGAQRRHHHLLAGIETLRLRRAHVVQQHVAVRAHQHSQALTDIKHDRFELARGGPPAVRPQQR